MDPTGVRVVICTYNSHADVSRAIESCLREGISGAHVTVVDNASTDGTWELVRRSFPQVRLLAEERNLGFAAAVNHGARETGGETLLLLNPDAELRPGALREMLGALAADQRRGAVSPRVIRPDGRLDPACRRRFPSPQVALWRLTGLSRLRPGSSRFGAYNLSHLHPDQPMAVDSGTGACLLIRRPLFDSVGGLDEGYFMYGEDLELCWQLHQRGAQVWYQPTAVVIHGKGRSSEQVALPMLVHFHRSMWRFYRLHYMRGAGAVLAPAVGAGILLRLAALLVLNSVRPHPRVSP
jgi:GT2 family glycosyltransferase